ncbi:MAG: outer membrane beta-barrel protein [Holosporales bacterium]|jgi:opacity protein-like surface antigen|nr:outer membrane beta-barrel protein [Holosporales bacterium]
MKKLSMLLTAGLVCTHASICQANDVVDQEGAASGESSAFSGFFAGVGGGTDFCSVEPKSVSGIDAKYTFKPKAFGLVLIAGYGQVLENQIYIGGELDISLKYSSKADKTITGKVDNVNVEAKIEIKRLVASFGGLFKLGYCFDSAPILVYGLLGFESWGIGCSVAATLGNKSETASLSGRTTALRLGAGASYKFDENWSVRLDLIYSFKKENELKNKDAAIKLDCGKFEIRALAAYNF